MGHRTKKVFNVQDIPDIKQRLFSWAKDSSPVSWHDSNEYPHQRREYDAILGIGLAHENAQLSTQKELVQFLGKDWLFGFFSYEYAQDWECVSPTNPAYLNIPTLQFFVPEKIWLLKGSTLTALYSGVDDPAVDFIQLKNSILKVHPQNQAIDLSPRVSRHQYVKKAQALQEHILRGDIYEVNYCVEWYAENIDIQPSSLFLALNEIAKTPYAAYVNIDDIHLMCASPERFLQRRGNSLKSQPIKGTAARHHDPILDTAAAQNLKEDSKECSENIMITDLVRNDLSRVAQKGSVTVEEQCVVYPFGQVHQMISTITATCDTNTSSLDIINACFPMGSMTGAPKQRAMELINQHENSQRGLYSGAVGYFAPNGDFDFNVVIRSLVYDADQRYISAHVGSALTAAADVEKEYEECQLKVKAIKQLLANQPVSPVRYGSKV